MSKYFYVFGFLCLLISPLWAHEGEVHDEEKPASPVVSQSGMITQEAATETVELVLKHPPIDPKKKVSLRLFLSTANENLPIGDAKIDLEIAALKDFKLSFFPIPQQPGIYSADAVFPKAGTFDAVISISGGEVNDLLTLNGIQVGALETGHRHSRGWVWAGMGIGFLFLVALATLFFRRRRHVA